VSTKGIGVVKNSIDQGGSAGPLLMIRARDDLVTLVFNGVSDSATAARRILNTARWRM